MTSLNAKIGANASQDTVDAAGEVEAAVDKEIATAPATPPPAPARRRAPSLIEQLR